MIPPDDRGLTLGVGLFETVFVRDGVPAHWPAHFARLSRGCAALALPAPTAAACRAVAEQALDAAGLARGPAALRLTWTGGSGGRGLAAPAAPSPRLFATASPWSPPPDAMTLATSTVRRNAFSPASRLKTLSYLDNVLARAEAAAAGADEALMLNGDGLMACAAASNLFWVEGDTLLTPTLRCGVLDGVVRDLVLRTAPRFGFRTATLGASLSRLKAAQGVFVTNSLIGAVAVAGLDSVPLVPGPVSGRVPGVSLPGLLAAVRDQAWSTTGMES